jgi:hypothetical protein
VASTLHIDPEILYAASRILVHADDQALDQMFDLRLSLLRLEAAWISPDADDFLAEMKSMVLELHERLEEMLTMSLILSRQADLWQETDQHWAREYRDAILPHLGD